MRSSVPAGNIQVFGSSALPSRSTSWAPITSIAHPGQEPTCPRAASRENQPPTAIQASVTVTSAVT
jgi:hypothetical protein